MVAVRKRNLSVRKVIIPKTSKTTQAGNWRPLEPIVGRASNRVSERELERVPAWISIPGDASGNGPTDIPVKLWDVSQFGFALLYDQTKGQSRTFQEGDSLQVKFDLREGPTSSGNMAGKDIPRFPRAKMSACRITYRLMPKLPIQSFT